MKGLFGKRKASRAASLVNALAESPDHANFSSPGSVNDEPSSGGQASSSLASGREDERPRRRSSIERAAKAAGKLLPFRSKKKPKAVQVGSPNGSPDPAPPQASSQMAAAPLPPLGGIPIVGATPLPAVSFVAPDSVASPNPAPQTQLPPHSLQKAGSSNDSVLSMLMRSAGDLWSGLNRTRKATTPNSLRLSWGSVSSLTADPTTEADDVAVPSLLLNDGASAGGGHATRQLSGAAAEPYAATEENGDGTDVDLGGIIDLAHLEAIVREQSMEEEGADDADAAGGQVALGELADLLSRGGSSMDALRDELSSIEPGSPVAMTPHDPGAFSVGGFGGAHREPPSSPSSLSTSDFSERQRSHGSSVPASSAASVQGDADDLPAAPAGKKKKKDEPTRNTMGRKDWTEEEDRVILEQVSLHGQKWRVVAAALPGRSDDAVRNRWKRLTANANQQAEAVADALFLRSDDDAIEGAGSPRSAADGEASQGAAGDAAAKATAAKPAKPKQERMAWSMAEDAEIVRCVQMYGLKWGRISQNLPGRTAHAIRNRFHRLQTLQAEQAALSGVTPPVPTTLPMPSDATPS